MSTQVYSMQVPVLSFKSMLLQGKLFVVKKERQNCITNRSTVFYGFSTQISENIEFLQNDKNVDIAFLS